MVSQSDPQDTIAVMRGGPLDGKEYPIFGKPEGAKTPVPKMFTVVHGQHFLIYVAREGFPTQDGVRYEYDWSHARPRSEE